MKHTIYTTILIVFGTVLFLSSSFAQFQEPVDFPVYVGDSGTKIAVIDAAGNITKRMPSGTLQLLGAPSGIAFDGEGKLYFAETALHKISTINVNTGDKTIVASSGLYTPSGLAFDSTGKLYVSEIGDSLGAGEISVVDIDTGEVTTIAEGLDGPIGIAFDKNGILYVAESFIDESLSCKISRIDPRGATVFPLEVSTVTGGFLLPNGLAFGNDGRLYVSEVELDASNPGRISALDLETRTVTHLEITVPEGQSIKPNKIAFDSAGSLYITDPTSKIWKVNLDTEEAEVFATGLIGPTYLAFTGQLDASQPKTAPVITSIEPNEGPTSGGTIVTIRGENFLPKAKVFFGDNQVVDMPVIVNEDGTEIRVVSTSGVEGPKDVTVENWDGQPVTLEDGFTYTEGGGLLGDVSGDDRITAYDASLILQFVVGIITEFPGAINPSPSVIPPRDHMVSVLNYSIAPGGNVRVPIIVDDASGITSGGIVLTYDADILKVDEVTPSGIMSGYYWQYQVQDNQIRIAFAGTEGMVGGGALFYVECESSLRAAGQQSPIILDKVQFGNSLKITKMHGSVKIAPAKTALLPNYPNPFNPETWLPYQLAHDAFVTISIHNAKGQLIRTLALGDKRGGLYATKGQAAYWDGTDNLGQPVASGIYFYTLKAGKFHATNRMCILK